jgi:ABC-type multidrug transport system permease subunit
LNSQILILTGWIVATFVATSASRLTENIDLSTFVAVFLLAIAFVLGAMTLLKSQPPLSGWALRIVSFSYWISAIVFGAFALQTML